MGRRIDTGLQPPAHTAIQAMLGRARIAANRDGKRVGVVCDLSNDRVLIVNVGLGWTDEAECLCVVEPGAGVKLVRLARLDAEKILPEGKIEEMCR